MAEMPSSDAPDDSCGSARIAVEIEPEFNR